MFMNSLPCTHCVPLFCISGYYMCKQHHRYRHLIYHLSTFTLLHTLLVFSYTCNIYVIMKTMCPPSYHHNDFVATNALVEYTVPKSMSCHKAIVVITRRVHWFYDYIYFTSIKFEHSVCCGSLLTTY